MTHERPRRSRFPGTTRRSALAIATGLAVAGVALPAQPGLRSPGGIRTGIFGLEAKGNRFVYVFDRSASMGDPDGRPLAAAKRELLRSLDELGDVQQFYLIFYNDRVQVFSPPGGRGRLNFATEDNRRAAGRFVESVRASGGTRHEEPLAAAFRLAPDVVFHLTDADAKDDLSEGAFDRLLRLGGGSRLLVVQVGDETQRSPRLAELAGQLGGRYLTLSPTRLADPEGDLEPGQAGEGE